MSKIIVTIDTDNAAFEGTEESEVARILRDFAATVEHHGLTIYLPCEYTLRDVNGNSVGTATIEK